MKPTYLYIKQHTVTGKCYFGKTIKNPETYNGSGTRWLRHLDVHGSHVDTLWFEQYTDANELRRVALLLSATFDIVKSELWLNLIPENGFDGAGRFGPRTPEQKAAHSAKMKGRKCKPFTDDHRRHLSESKMGIVYSDIEDRKQRLRELTKSRIGVTLGPRSDKVKAKISQARKGKSGPLVKCTHCSTLGSKSIMTRWHFDNCKLNTKESRDA